MDDDATSTVMDLQPVDTDARIAMTPTDWQPDLAVERFGLGRRHIVEADMPSVREAAR